MNSLKTDPLKCSLCPCLIFNYPCRAKAAQAGPDEEEKKSIERICVLAAGSFGTAIGSMFARNGHPVIVLDRNESRVKAINEDHKNPDYLSDLTLPTNLTATTDPVEAFKDATMVFHAVPIQGSRKYLEQFKEYIKVCGSSRVFPCVSWMQEDLGIDVVIVWCVSLMTSVSDSSFSFSRAPLCILFPFFFFPRILAPRSNYFHVQGHPLRVPAIHERHRCGGVRSRSAVRLPLRSLLRPRDRCPPAHGTRYRVR